jgi:hypothetical protein
VIARRDDGSGIALTLFPIALVEKRPADPGQKPAGSFVISEAGGDQGGRLAQVTTFSMESSSASSDVGSFRSMR